MSRQIDVEAPLSKEDKEYLLARGKDDLVAWNEGEFGEAKAKTEPADKEPEDPFAGFDSDDVAYVEASKVEDLKSDLQQRGVEPVGKKLDLQVALLKALAAESEEDDEDNE